MLLLWKKASRFSSGLQTYFIAPTKPVRELTIAFKGEPCGKTVM